MFQNRAEAGRLLANKIDPKYAKVAVVVALARGGVVVGNEIAQKFSIPLYPIAVKKLRAPHNPELAIGAVLPDGTKYIDWELALRIGTDQGYLDKEIEIRKNESTTIQKKYNSRMGENLKNKTVILADDGVATGSTVKAAISYLKQKEPSDIMLAVPVIAKETYTQLQSDIKHIITLEIALEFHAVGQFFRDFPQVSDEVVIKIISNKPINQ